MFKFGGDKEQIFSQKFLEGGKWQRGKWQRVLRYFPLWKQILHNFGFDNFNFINKTKFTD